MVDIVLNVFTVINIFIMLKCVIDLKVKKSMDKILNKMRIPLWAEDNEFYKLFYSFLTA